MNNHQEIDAFSLAAHIYLCGRLRDQPEKLELLAACVSRWMEYEEVEGSRVYLREWKKAIERGIDAVIDLCLEESDHGQVLRSCSPFGVLWTAKERWEFRADWRRRRRAGESLSSDESV